MKMKSGGTDMAHKAEHAVDMSGEGAVIAVTLHGGAKGDTKSLPDTLLKHKRRVNICKSSRTTRNVVNEYMKTRVAKWSGTRAITATTSWLSWSNNEYSRATFRSQSEVAAKWKDKQAEQAANSTRTDVAFAGHEASD